MAKLDSTKPQNLTSVQNHITHIICVKKVEELEETANTWINNNLPLDFNSWSILEITPLQ